MNGLCLFAGSGISELALKAVIPDYRTVCYVENDGYCVAQIASRIKDGCLDDAPIWDDVRTFDSTLWREKVDIVVGGFPCQPFSVAGQNKGADDERNCWPDTRRIISEVRPRYALLENVPNLLAHEYIRTVFGELAEIGYDCEWDVVSAAFVGAPHLRRRLWIVAINSDRAFKPEGAKRAVSGTEQAPQSTGVCENVAYAERVRELQPQGSQCNVGGRVSDGGEDVSDATNHGDGRWSKLTEGCQEKRRIPVGQWQTEPNVGRVANGIPLRVDRLKSIGNAWVPQVVASILRTGVE